MARTERRQWQHDPGWNHAWIDPSCRDSGCTHWGCNGWKRPDRRSQRAKAKQALRRRPSEQ